MTQYKITVTTTIDDTAQRFSAAEAVKDELTRFAIWHRVAFADKMTVQVEALGADEQSEDDRADPTSD
jgi:hypothetical protein